MLETQKILTLLLDSKHNKVEEEEGEEGEEGEEEEEEEGQGGEGLGERGSLKVRMKLLNRRKQRPIILRNRRRDGRRRRLGRGRRNLR